MLMRNVACVLFFVVVELFGFLFFCFFYLISELIYKEVLDWEERSKNGVIRGQPASVG